MMKKIAFLMVALFLFACDSAAGDPMKTLTIITKDGTRHEFTVELANTPQTRETGLMYRTKMADDAGMLFIFEDEAERGFWMKNTYIPLDIIFIRRDGTIRHIHENATPQDLTSIRSNGAAYAVLELNGGISAKLGLEAGDKVDHALLTQ